MHREILGSRLRDLRMERGLSLGQLARATGISSSFLSLVEQARSEITIGRLLRLADFYDVDLSDLVSGGHSEPKRHVHVLKTDGAKLIRSDQEGVEVYDLTAGAHWTLVPLIGVHDPGGGVEVNDLHEREAMVFVLDGAYEIAFEGEEPVQLSRGEGAIYRSTAPYRVTNIGRTRGRLLAITLAIR